MVKILLQRADRKLWTYHVKSRKGYLVLRKRGRRNVYVKGVMHKGILGFPTQIESEPLIGKRQEVLCVFRANDYGVTGHKVSFDCTVSEVFDKNDELGIETFIRESRSYMYDRCIDYGFTDDLIHTIFGTEKKFRMTDAPLGMHEESFKYTHGKAWRKF